MKKYMIKKEIETYFDHSSYEEKTKTTYNVYSNIIGFELFLDIFFVFIVYILVLLIWIELERDLAFSIPLFVLAFAILFIFSLRKVYEGEFPSKDAAIKYINYCKKNDR